MWECPYGVVKDTCELGVSGPLVGSCPHRPSCGLLRLVKPRCEWLLLWVCVVRHTTPPIKVYYSGPVRFPLVVDDYVSSSELWELKCIDLGCCGEYRSL